MNASQGWVGKYTAKTIRECLHKEKGHVNYSMHTTPEYAFAFEFNSQKEAEKAIKKYNLCVLLVERTN